MRLFSRLLALAPALCLSASLSAAPIVPVSYTATPGEGQLQGGTWNYFDDNGSQLIDGVLGANDFEADLGNGPAYEWVAWRFANPTLNFNFASAVDVGLVRIGFAVATAGAGIALPHQVTIGGSIFNLAGNEIPNLTRTRGFVDFAVNFTGISSLSINLLDSTPGSWIFVDEVRFEGFQTPPPSVPEPSSTALLGMALASFALTRRRRQQRTERAL